MHKDVKDTKDIAAETKATVDEIKLSLGELMDQMRSIGLDILANMPNQTPRFFIVLPEELFDPEPGAFGVCCCENSLPQS